MIDFIRSVAATEWEALTAHAWFVIAVLVVVFFAMIGIYFYVFRPKNRAYLEAQRDMALRDDEEEKDD